MVEVAKTDEAEAIRKKLLQAELDGQTLAERNLALQRSLDAVANVEKERQNGILLAAFKAGKTTYSRLRWSLSIAVGILSGVATWLASQEPTLPIAIGASFLLGAGGFWFVPELLDKPLHAIAMRRLKGVVTSKDASVNLPSNVPDFRTQHWVVETDKPQLGIVDSTAANGFGK
ncbi:MAG: hypothetical protein EPO09_01500 [Aquabacterium sp.]|uniref:hypothetical protein n=1 Tax=Aquabacterium sp. TaxID=1872578 RepID=UPI0012122A21|nr:hypothetical protein [Aquabacterium sp.]TAK99171.1 MAG: hypothetical protein EPO09_01500 [Aquabacterium sp.]